MPNTINPKSLKIVHRLPPFATKGDKVAIDSEFFGQDKNRLHRPHGQFAFLGCTFDGKTIYYVTDPSQIQEFFDRLDVGVWIYHHAKYDLTQLRRFAYIPNRKKLWDTMLVEQIQYSGYYNEFSLADVARRRLDVYLPKEIRKEFSTIQVEGHDVIVEKYGKSPYDASGGHLGASYTMTQDMVDYAAIDVAVTFQIYQSQRAEIDDTDLGIWRDIELPFLWTLLSMGGVKLDTESWLKLAKENGEKAKAIQDEYGRIEDVEKEIQEYDWLDDDEDGEKNAIPIPTKKRKVKKPKFVGTNLNSPAQVKKALNDMGYDVKSTGEEVLSKLADKHVQFATDVLAYRRYSKRSSTYGEKFITDHVEPDGKIYADIYQIGAETARTSCRHPNLQNQPNEAEYRSCFVADDGKCMVVADYGSQEPRIAAYFSQDERLIEILNSGKKLYIEIARDVFGIEITKQHELYGHIKSTILGIFYGMSAYGLSGRLGVSEDEAQEMIDKIIKTYPGIQDYIDQQKKSGDYVQSIYGRKIWLNKYEKGWLRGALNYPIQSSAADATKLAVSRFNERTEAESNWKILLLVHDEIVISVPECDVESAKKVLEGCMVEVAEEMHDGLKGVAEVFSGSNWAVKH